MVPVLASRAEQKDVPVILEAIGRVRPPASVAIKAQVGGQIAKAHFTEGEEVKEGDLLFTIDPRPFEVALALARAAFAQAQAQAKNAREQAARYASLGETGTVPREQADQFQNTAVAAEAAVQAADASVNNAQLQLDYCAVLAPLSGRTGRVLVDPGNVVRANETDLVIINQIQPIEVLFSLAERHLPEVQQQLREDRLKVVANPEGQKEARAEGELRFVDNAVKPTSGTIDLKATFENADRVLWPGQFVSVELWLRIERGVWVVPAKAVQTGQKGPFIYVVQADRTAQPRNVVVKRTVRGQAVIAQGLQSGETVVTDGQSRLVPGARVEIKAGLDGQPESTDPARSGATLTLSGRP